MIFIGIVGALSPLGRKMLDVLRSYPSYYEVVWTVDAHYSCDDEKNSEFKILENVFASKMSASLVLDFGDDASLFERAKLYRRNNLPAIIQGVLSDEQITVLQGFCKETSIIPRYEALILEPDFSIIKTQMMKNLLCQAHHCVGDVEWIKINIFHHSDRKCLQKSWLYWAKLINKILGVQADNPILKETKFRSTLSLGVVQIDMRYKFGIDLQEESIRIDMFLNDKKGSLSWQLSTSLLQSRIDGITLLMDWYESEHNNNQNLVFGNVLVDVLPTLI
ncbi:MAG: hypothetical protein IJ218_05985 [Alphaproteobacteria bacterium]|nr:hypothetical protein [Alphaproteobacteria bacterium]